jgi:AraC-like DNA-binding protein
LRLAALYLDIQDRGAVSLTLDLGDGKSALGYSIFEGKAPAAEQILDGAIAMQYLLLRDLCGPSWNPVLIQLSHSRPTKIAPFQKHFRAPLEFDARISGIVFESRWLDHRIEGADPAAFAAISKAIASNWPQLVMPFVAQVRRALYAMMFTGTASSTNLARLFNLNERTLRRRLEKERVSVRSLLSDARRELAHHLLRDTGLSVSEIAAILRHSDVTVFARAFRGWSDMSPREWRARYGSAR